MFILWGFGTRNNNTKVLISDYCDVCGHSNVMTIHKTFYCFTLFLIPIITWGTKYFIVCPRCGAGRQISKQEFNNLKKRYKSTGQVVSLNSNVVNNNMAEETVNDVKTQIQEKSLNTKIVEEIDKTMAKIKANSNYTLTEEKINKLKNALKQNLTKKFGEEQIVNIAVDEYFKKVR